MNASLRLFRLFLALLLSAAASLCAAQTYKITDLGDLPGGSFSQAQTINASGQISGMAGDSKGNGAVILYSKGKMADLGSLGGGKAIGNAINKSAQVAGYSTNAAGTYRAFVTVDGQLVGAGRRRMSEHVRPAGCRHLVVLVGQAPRERLDLAILPA